MPHEERYPPTERMPWKHEGRDQGDAYKPSNAEDCHHSSRGLRERPGINPTSKITEETSSNTLILTLVALGL